MKKRAKRKILPFLLAMLIIVQNVYGFSSPVYAAELPTQQETTEETSEEASDLYLIMINQGLLNIRSYEKSGCYDEEIRSGINSEKKNTI